MNARILVLFVLFVLFSCEKDEINSPDFSSEINFDVTEWILKDRDISCVDFDKDGFAWMASGKELISYNNREIEIYDSGATITDIAVAPNGIVWLGTREGLARFSGGKFKFYSEENAGLPRNYVHSLGVASNGKVWFCSAAGDLGGLMSYDGRRFKLFSPENSILNQHVIQNLKIDRDDNVYFNSMGQVGKAIIYKIGSNNNMEKPGGETSLYWISDLDINSKGAIYFMVDYSLSSYSGNKNFVGYVVGNKWNKLENQADFYPKVFIDKRDYIWTMGSIGGDYFSFFVYDGKQWKRSEKDQIPEKYFKSIKVDNQNNIWFCTSEGIFILHQ